MSKTTLERFQAEMRVYRACELAMEYLSEDLLNEEQKSTLNALCAAYERFYMQEWGIQGPKGAVLRVESEDETTCRQAWEQACLRARPPQEDDSDTWEDGLD